MISNSHPSALFQSCRFHAFECHSPSTFRTTSDRPAPSLSFAMSQSRDGALCQLERNRLQLPRAHAFGTFSDVKKFSTFAHCSNADPALYRRIGYDDLDREGMIDHI